MDPLAQQVRELPGRLVALPRAVLVVGAVLIAGSVGTTAYFTNLSAESWQYAYSGLSTEDSAEVAAALKSAGVPFRLEAGGAALAVPADKVYDARLLLAAAGLPRGGGSGFELFDKGDLGVSEFTQKVNLRRALEGELARTIGHLADVRSARVHLTLSEKGLYRDEEHKASGAVALQLQTGKKLGEREISGIRHLVASSVPGLAAEAVTIVDGRGMVLTTESMWGEAEAFRQRELEKDLEARLVSLLEPVVGPGSVVARVSATLDGTEQSTSKETIDPQTTLRTEHKSSQSASSDAGGPGGAGGGVAGAAANQPLLQVPAVGGGGPTLSRNNNTTLDESRTFEVGRTVTRTVAHGARLTKLSVALLVDGKEGEPRTDEELQQLAELARKAVGFDAARGDQLEITSSVFTRSTEPEVAPVPQPRFKIPAVNTWTGPAALAIAVLALLLFLIRGRPAAPPRAALELRPGERVASLEAVLADAGGVPGAAAAAALGAGAPAAGALGAEAGPKALPFEQAPDPNVALRDRARELVAKDPERAALLLRAWIAKDESTR